LSSAYLIQHAKGLAISFQKALVAGQAKGEKLPFLAARIIGNPDVSTFHV
jgi:hypothetical protein